ncbi:MAG: hypothetical protein WC742_10905 [Gallionellaceae bacterium]|jgi:Tfp pilus assembly protein PilF
MKNKLSIGLLSRWIIAPLLVACLIAWSVSPAHSGDTPTAREKPAASKQAPNPSPKNNTADTNADIQELKTRIKELEAMELEGQRKKVDWWLSFLGIMLAGLAIVITVAGIAIPYVIARKNKEIFDLDKKAIERDKKAIEQDRAQVRTWLDEIEKLKYKANADTEAIKQKLEIVSGSPSATSEDVQQTARRTAQDETADPLLRLRAKAVESSRPENAQEAYTLWATLTELGTHDANAMFNAAYWAHELSDQAQSDEKLRWLRLAGNYYAQTLTLKPNMHDAAYNWGGALNAEATALAATDHQAARALWKLAGEKYQLALSIKSDMHEAANNWGSALNAEARALAATDLETARALWKLAGEKYQLALSIKSNMPEAGNNWGSALNAEAKALAATDLHAARALWKLAGEKFQLALSIKSDQHEAANNWGVALDDEARALAATDPQAARALWKLAGEKFQLALSINSNMHEAANNWGIALYAEATALAATDHQAARTLWKLAGEKYQLALSIKSDMHEAAINWGSALITEASTDKDVTRSQQLLNQAEQLLLAHADADPGLVAYNLACIYGLRVDVQTCLHWLNISQSHKKLPDCSHLQTDKDLDAVRNSPEFIAWLATVCNDKQA